MKFEQSPKNEGDQKFNNFIHKDEYWLTDSDMSALATMKDKSENEDEDSEFKFIRGNHVFLGELNDTVGFYEMKKESNDYDIERFSKKQVFVTQLASSLIPIAPIGIKDGKFYSKLVQNHEAFSRLSEKNTPLFALVEIILFRDIDKPGSDRPNILGGVSFDFDYASFEEEDKPNYQKNLDYILANMHFVNQKDIKLMLKLVEKFEQQILREEGRVFLNKNMDISGYKQISTDSLQKVLINRVNELKSYLDKFLKTEEGKNI
ncbi:MAG: hypothetical protein K9M36_02750 [Candidatus Pacebacteria bacterium]|nr:hypothetical protein [Candidatus Paceibacterota bacterium]